MKNIIRTTALAVAFLLTALVTVSNAPVAYAAPAATSASAQAAKPAVTPDQFYHSAWQAAKDNFLWQDRLNDWGNWEHKFDGKLATFKDAELAINQMLGTLKDGYTYYKDPQVTKDRSARADERNVVTYKMLPGNIGYVRLRTFGSNHAYDEFKAALKALSGADAYVIDLRDNGGGYVNQAFKLYSLFVDKGSFTTLKGMYEGAPYSEELVVTATGLDDIENGKTTTSARDANMTGSKPVTILVNGDSASASEMFSGAMRDSGRATLVGTLTYGKGIAQITVDLERGASVQVTFAQYYLPSGVCIHKVGITPSIVVTPVAGSDAQLNAAVNHLKKELGK